jgi:hypothetical protein
MPENEQIKDEKPEGPTVPAPKRETFVGNPGEVVEPEEPVEADEDPSPPHGDPLR